MALSAGMRLGPYEIQSAIGAGGMGEVYRAFDTRLHRTVAIKVLPSDKFRDPERKRRFLQEARAASALSHPHIVTLHDIASDNGVDFLVMEFVDGKSLKEAIPSTGLPFGRRGSLRDPDRERAGRGACKGHRSSRHQARQHHPVGRLAGEGARLWFGEARWLLGWG